MDSILTDNLTREKMNCSSFELYEYNDTALVDIPIHSHDHYELYVFVDGSVDFWVNEKLYNVSYNDIIIIPPNIPHKIIVKDNDKPYKGFVLWLHKDFCRKLKAIDADFLYTFKWAEDTLNYKITLPENIILGLISKFYFILDESYSDKFCKNVHSQSLIVSLLVNLDRIVYSQTKSNILNSKQQLAGNISHYIVNHLTEELTLDKIASKFFLSKYYICHVFKDIWGVSVQQFITQERLNTAKNLILQGEPIGKVHANCGFKDYASLYRAFTKEFGVSPQKFKNIYQNKSLMQG